MRRKASHSRRAKLCARRPIRVSEKLCSGIIVYIPECSYPRKSVTNSLFTVQKKAAVYKTSEKKQNRPYDRMGQQLDLESAQITNYRRSRNKCANHVVCGRMVMFTCETINVKRTSKNKNLWPYNVISNTDGTYAYYMAWR